MATARDRGITRAVMAALLLAGPMGIACRDAPLSPQRIQLPAPTLAVAALTEDVQLLRTLVGQLERDGALTAGQANALMNKIDAGVRRLEAGGEKRVDNAFGAFFNQVSAFVTARVLTAKQAQPLLDAALSLTGNGVTRRPLAAGYRFTCSLAPTGDARCWGSNPYGQLGDGTTQTRLAPAAVQGGLVFRQITGGIDHACGLTGDGVAYCWGRNQAGQLGDASNTDRRAPTAVATSLRFTDITAGGHHTCGLTRSGTAYCWGSNGVGALGNASWSDRNAPTPVAGGLSFRELRAGTFHTCATGDPSGSYCWGWNAFGQLGDGTRASRNVPTSVVGGTEFRELEAYWVYSCALTAGGSAYCWGRVDDDELVPIELKGGRTFAAIGEGGTRGTHNCGISTSGPTYCWGPNNYGQLGDGTNIWTSLPTMVVGGYSFTRVTGGGEHNCGLTVTGAIYCWGGNFAGQLGDGTTTSRNRPTPIAGGG
jgi:alpha-tubulin suppressor-like RCC1 family protein